MDKAAFSSQTLPLVEAAMAGSLEHLATAETGELHAMLTYHMGWAGEGAGLKARGKRIRPLLVLLAYRSVQPGRRDWSEALPAAAAVELLHNFSLIHDDIQDNSALRRGRPTLWVKWGIPQAINAGDALYTVAFQTLLELSRSHAAALVVEAQTILLNTCSALTQGQYLDLAFEQRREVTTGEYWAMIDGKTAALLAASAELGALTGGAGNSQREAFREFGRSLGLAFQVQDDILGIWGDEGQTGKSSAGDLAAGKKSLPVVHGLAQGGAFAERWIAGPVQPAEAPGVAAMLEAEGGRRYAEEEAAALTARALQSLEAAGPQGEAGELLAALADSLLNRRA